MSYKTYNEVLSSLEKSLSSLISQDKELQKSFYEERRDLVTQLKFLYVHYVRIGKQLDLCHDNIVQPQRRLLVRTLLDGVLCRTVELKHELVALDYSDVQHCDSVMHTLGLSPKDMEVCLPTYIRRERLEDLYSRKSVMEEILKNAGFAETIADEASEMDFLTALKLIQRHERARQGRKKFDLRKQMIARQELSKSKRLVEFTTEEAVVKIQAHFRGAMTRKKLKEIRKEEELFLGLRAEPSVHENYVKNVKQLETVRDERYKLQKIRVKEIERANQRIRDKIMYNEGASLMGDIENSIREWIFQEKNETGKFPDFPEEEDGGSKAILGNASHFVYVPIQPSVMPQTAEKEMRDDPKGKKKEAEVGSFAAKPTTVLPVMATSCNDVTESRLWNESQDDCEEYVIESLLETDVRVRVEEEIRSKVDNLMRSELQRLKEDVEGEKRGSKKKKKRVKRGKGRKRKDKDLTPDRTTESLFEELVLNGILKKVPEISMKDIPGTINLTGSAISESSSQPMPFIADIRNVVIEYLGLPLGIETVRNSTLTVKSLLLCGPKGSGKLSLIHGLCHDLGATLFDLTATNIVGRYPGKAGLNMLTHLVMKVGRLLQPSIILIDEAEKMFMRKTPKTDKSDPKRLKKELPKVIKNIALEDKIAVVGISNSPWKCDMKSLSTVYQKIVMVNRPSFGARCELWRHFISKAGGEITSEFDLASLARITDGYCAEHFDKASSETLTEYRLLKVKENPLHVEEFIPHLAKLEPVYKEEEEAFKLFFGKTPLMKKRSRQMEEEEAEALAKAKAEGKGEKIKVKIKSSTSKKDKKSKKKKSKK